MSRTPPRVRRSAASKPRLHAVVLAGGAGERFWPASRATRPKPFLEVVGGRSLLEATLARARRCARSADRVWIVCGVEHAAAMRRASGLPASRTLVEPERRNTAMACAWIALRVQAEDPDAVLAVLPADHHVPDEKAFAADIERAARAARAADVLVTLGVEPTRPETGYGYIHVGKAVGRAHPRLHQVQRFVEKPNLTTARRYLAGREHLWNAGVFVWSAAAFLAEVERHTPDLHAALEPLRARPKSQSGKALRRTYALAPSLPVDVAVLERSQRVWTLPVRFAWSDVGTWQSLADELGVGKPSRGASRQKQKGLDADGNHVIAGEVLCQDSSGNLIWGGRRLVALLGVDELAVIDCDDVILVTRLDRSPDVRRFVAELKARGRSELL